MRRGVLAGVLSAGVMAMLLPASAWASWTDPVQISGDCPVRLGHVIEVGPGGDVVLSWSEDCHPGTQLVKSRVAGPDGTLGPVQTVAKADHLIGPDVDVAVDPDGNAVFAWQTRNRDGRTYRIQARTRFADGTLGPIRTLSPPTQHASRADIAIDAHGEEVVLWATGSGGLYARRRALDGTLGPMRTLAGNVSEFDMAADATGDALVVWHQLAGPIQGRVLAADGSLSPVRGISGDGRAGFGLEVDIDEHGNAAIAWDRFDGENQRIQARTWATDGELGPVQTLSSPGRDASGPELAMDRRGNAVVAWLQTRIRTRTLRANGTLSGVQPVSPRGESASEQRVGVDADGNAVFAWTGHAGGPLVETRTRSAGKFGPVTSLSPEDENADNPQLAVGPDGTGAVSWLGEPPSSSGLRVEAAFGP